MFSKIFCFSCNHAGAWRHAPGRRSLLQLLHQYHLFKSLSQRRIDCKNTASCPCHAEVRGICCYSSWMLLRQSFFTPTVWLQETHSLPSVMLNLFQHLLIVIERLFGTFILLQTFVTFCLETKSNQKIQSWREPLPLEAGQVPRAQPASATPPLRSSVSVPICGRYFDVS